MIKKISFLALITLWLFSFAFAIAGHKPQVEWPLENLTDINENTTHTVVGVPEIVDGLIGKAFKFNGLTDGIIVEDNPIDMAPEFTIEMYIKPEANPGVKAKLFNIWNVDESQSALFLECWGKDSTKTYDLQNKVVLKTAFKTPRFNTATLFSQELDAGKWYHLAWVSDTTGYTFYINGVRSHGTVFTKHYMYDDPDEYYQPFTGGNVTFGCRGGSKQKDFYKGLIDNIRITRKVLTPEEFMPPPDEVVWYQTWTLESAENIEGASGDVTVVGVPEVVGGLVGNAIQFNGITDGIIVDENPIDMSPEFTIEMYIKPEANPGVKAKLFNPWNVDETQNALFLECWGKDSTKTYDLQNKVVLKTAFKTPRFNTGTLFSQELDVGKWYHIAWVSDTTGYTFYINGVRSHGCVFTQQYMYDDPDEYYQPFTGGNVTFGCRGGSNQKDFYKGLIDNIRITRKVLTPEEFMPTPDEIMTSVQRYAEMTTIPLTMKLLQNYPNPFNPTTTIRYELSKSGDVTLKIFNILGKEVRELIAENQQPGTYHVFWDGKDYFGNSVSGGVFFYMIKAGNFTETRKMILLK